MSQTVAFLFPAASDNGSASLVRLAAEAGYSVVRGVERGNPEVVDGIKAFCRFDPLDLDVFYLVSDSDNNDAYSVYKDVQFSASRSAPSRFFQFLQALVQVPEELPKYMIACTEWTAKDEAVWLEGTIDNLIDYLKVVNTFGLLLWSPITGVIQDSDRYPLVFRIID